MAEKQIVEKLLAVYEQPDGIICPICRQPVKVTRENPDEWQAKGCFHLACKSGSGCDNDPQTVLKDLRSWQGDRYHHWPFRGGWAFYSMKHNALIRSAIRQGRVHVFVRIEVPIQEG